MRYLKAYQQDFPHTVVSGDLTLHLDQEGTADILEPISSLMAQRKNGTLRRSISGCMRGVRSRLFVKAVELESLPSRLRVTLGRQRRLGGYDWPIAELMNSVDAWRQGASVPRLRGFGYRRQGLFPVRELFLISDMLDGHVDGKFWLTQPQMQIEAFLQGAFALIRELHEKHVCHLDLWAGNIMLDPQRLDAMKVVDLENCYIGHPPYWSEALGFQFAFLFLRLVQDHIDEARYDHLVQAALDQYPGIDRVGFERVYSLCKHQQISRKKRRDLLLTGNLQLRG
ncbi:lipopolysaccharide kinase InaA family protein [Pseudomonas sp. SG20056]|uniref:lipopolysaccharide kinase InaA family protein n=1 Tax=Pseudomonas sp. SG20056 TaxID=3074146 RepID=UPI00287FC490|nr:lipopolysaccharide kinase InaA family protein [Pseudomonas sp. SG20056]WNF45875.1 lipopolysaccharide kinase InaA family protein [Pseudomonas sp. SG20056]